MLSHEIKLNPKLFDRFDKLTASKDVEQAPMKCGNLKCGNQMSTNL